MKTDTTQLTAMSVVNQGDWCQESYDSSSRQARKRATQLRRLGYAVRCSSMGPQVTQVGVVVLTMVDIRPGMNADTFGLPQVARV